MYLAVIVKIVVSKILIFIGYISSGLLNSTPGYNHLSMTRQVAAQSLTDDCNPAFSVAKPDEKGIMKPKPVFRRSTRKIPSFSSSPFSFFLFWISFFPIFTAKIQCPFWAFLLKKFLKYVIIMVLHGTLSEVALWHTC